MTEDKLSELLHAFAVETGDSKALEVIKNSHESIESHKTVDSKRYVDYPRVCLHYRLELHDITTDENGNETNNRLQTLLSYEKLGCFSKMKVDGRTKSVAKKTA